MSYRGSSVTDTQKFVDAAHYDALATELAEWKRGSATVNERLLARISELEAALHEIADFSEQFIADDEDGDERMYKVNQIADTALAHAASGATTAANRGAEHGE
jgi:Ni,Fe-hydrogenase I large subunit